MEICLHIGAHRTGTTGLQTLLQRHRGVLHKNGVAFIGPKRTRSGFLAGLIKNPDYLSAADSALGERSCGRIAMEIARLRHDGVACMVLSEENMMGTMLENLATVRLYGQARARLARFAPAFAAQKPTVCLAVRSYEMHWASQLAFRIKAGSLVPSARDIDAIAQQPRCWRDVIADIKAALPNATICVWSFEDWAGRSGALAQHVIGRSIGLPRQADDKRSNSSAMASDLADLVRGRGDRTGADLIASHDQNGRYMPFSPQHQAQMQRQYCDDLAWLSAGAEGLATYLDPIEGTFDGHDMTEGSPDDRPEASVAGPR